MYCLTSNSIKGRIKLRKCVINHLRWGIKMKMGRLSLFYGVRIKIQHYTNKVATYQNTINKFASCTLLSPFHYFGGKKRNGLLVFVM